MVPVELKDFDAVVFDPPRAGRRSAGARAGEIEGAGGGRRVVRARTFARDAAILIAGGYRLEKLTPVDQFAWSTHVELVGVFRR